MSAIKNSILWLTGSAAMSKPGQKFLKMMNRRGRAEKGDHGHSCLRIFNYHRVLPGHPRFVIDVIDLQEFEQQVQILTSYFNVCSLESAIPALQRGELPPDSVCITFDDGYKDNYEYALPVLAKYGAPATIFLTTDYISNQKFLWHDLVLWAFATTETTKLTFDELGLHDAPLLDQDGREKVAVHVLEKLKTVTTTRQDELINMLYERMNVTSLPPASYMLDWQQIRDMSAMGLRFGAHTKSHAILSKLDDEALEEEIVGSRKAIELHLPAPVTSFAYPNGRRHDFDERAKKILRESGFQCAVTTYRGLNYRSQDVFELNRTAAWERNPHRFYGRLLLEQLFD
ncbi:polysaccharide deacetylase family protein [candidate division KSB1 bacterium]|nr:polysaccharide deacetylase family protein [candidate division KSB1 bacterium]